MTGSDLCASTKPWALQVSRHVLDRDMSGHVLRLDMFEHVLNQCGLEMTGNSKITRLITR